MWLPTRNESVSSRQVNGYSIKSTDGSRFPSSGYAIYNTISYDSLFEALNTAGVDENVSVYDLDSAFQKKAKNRTFGQFNPCQHYKRNVSMPGDAALTTKTWAGSGESDGYYTNYGRPGTQFWEDNIAGLEVHPGEAFGSCELPILGIARLFSGTGGGGVTNYVDNYVARALSSMLPQIRPKTSLINSIYELKDIETIPRSIATIKKSLTALKSVFGSSWGLKTLKAIVKGPADVFLQKEFNVMPLLQDILITSNSVQNVKRQLNKLIDDANQPSTKHFRCDIEGLNNSDELFIGAASLPGPVTTGGSRRIVTYTQRQFAATLEYTYRMPEGNVEALLYRGLADHLALTPSLQVLWNAVPWSFVIDWFVGIGPWLSQFNPRQLNIVTHISKFGVSSHVKRTIRTYIMFGTTVPVSVVEEDAYIRIPMAPPLVSSLSTSGLNSNEFDLSVALGLTR